MIELRMIQSILAFSIVEGMDIWVGLITIGAVWFLYKLIKPEDTNHLTGNFWHDFEIIHTFDSMTNRNLKKLAFQGQHFLDEEVQNLLRKEGILNRRQIVLKARFIDEHNLKIKIRK